MSIYSILLFFISDFDFICLFLQVSRNQKLNFRVRKILDVTYSTFKRQESNITHQVEALHKFNKVSIIFLNIHRNRRPAVFCKKSVLRNLTKIHRKTPVPESLF